MKSNKISVCLMLTTLALWKIQHAVAESMDEEKRCQIPLDLGDVIVKNGNEIIKPGDFVDAYNVIRMECVFDNRRFESNYAFCVDGKFPENCFTCNDDQKACQPPMDLKDAIIIRHKHDNETVKPGDFVDENEHVFVECIINNVRTYSNGLICLGGVFTDPLPNCRVFCNTSLVNDPSTIYEVFSSRDELLQPYVYENGIPFNSTVEVRCASGYTRASIKFQNSFSNRQIMHCLENGTFDQLIEPCKREEFFPVLVVGPYHVLSKNGKKRCEIPFILQNIVVKRHTHGNKTMEPGDFVEEGEVVHVECKMNNLTAFLGSVLCCDGFFSAEFPKCKVVCDSQHLEGLSTIYNVFAPYGQFVEPSLHRFGIPIGSVVEINCASGFKRDFNWQTEFLTNRQNLTCLPNGTFDQVRVACIQDCGHPLVSIYPLTKGGIQTDPNKVPWHVSIYQRVEVEWVFICGGSIITPRLILSAAHCFWDNKLRRLFSQNQFQFVAGKYRRGFNDPETGKPQIRNAQIIHVSERFEGPRNRSFADIAVIKLDLPLIYNENVSAICYKPAGGLTRYFVPSNITGIVTGYNELNNSLEHVTMTSAGYNECILHDSIGATLSQDKFCLYNGHDEGVCRGDSGSGFAQELKIYGESLFSLLGIISFSPGTVNGCAREGYIAVTNAKYMLDDLFDKFRKEMEEELSLL